MRSLGTCGRFAIVLAALALAAGPLLADDGALHKVKQVPPVIMGTSGGSALDIGTAYCCGGTLGSVVRYDGVLSILSNNHILARSGLAVVGEADIQPGLLDLACSATNANIVGTFPGNKVPLGTANVDAAISTANANVDSTGTIMDIGIPCSEIQTPVVGLNVIKSGRTTGLTYGRVQAVNTSVSIKYQMGCKTGTKFTVSYTNQVTIVAVAPSTLFSTGGDSGSLIVSNDGTPNPTSLLFAGSTSTTIGNPIASVVSAFQAGGHTFTFVGNVCGAAASSAYTLVPTGQGRGPSENDLDFARTIKERHEMDLFARPGVIGVGVGAMDDNSTEAAIIVYVNAPQGSLPHGFPSEMDGVKLRVIPTEPFVAF